MKTAFAYIRVSTTKQGREGASLPEQKDSIQKFCDRNNLHVTRWFEEQESAAGRGRKLFNEMMKLVKKGKAEALVFHKIDRSTRNLFEWAEVSSLPEIGIDVHYSHEPVDLTTLHGRTAADVAAVFASAYIRNLREEVKKGLNGRLKAGIYPFKAPIGYLDNGGGKLKTIDPVKGPLVKKLFLKYATGEYSYLDLLEYAKQIGLSGNRRTELSKTGLAIILKNPFYTGLMYIKKQSVTYQGNHTALISIETFQTVQRVIGGKQVAKKTKSEFLFKRMIKCETCGYSLVGERKRETLIYYRCHNCKGLCLKEEFICREIDSLLSKIELSTVEVQNIEDDLLVLLKNEGHERITLLRNQSLQIDALNARIDRLTDAYLDQTISKEEFELKKRKMLEEKSLKVQEHFNLSENILNTKRQTQKFLEQLFSFSHNYFLGNHEKKRIMLKTITSNISISEKSLVIKWEEPFQTLIMRGGVLECGLQRLSSSSRHKVTDDKHLYGKREFWRKIAELIIERVASGASLPELDIVPKSPPFPPSAPSKNEG
jgi:site-specific DNA recombinase